MRETHRERNSKALGLTVVCGLLGFVVNGWALPVVGQVSLVFGGALSLVVALAHGPVWGGLAAALASSRTLLLWGHPWAMLVSSLEGVVLGWLVQRRLPPVLASLSFWLIVGIPLLGGLHIAGWLTHSSSYIAWAVVIKQAMNGLVNVLLAELLVTSPVARRLADPHLGRRRSLRSYLIHGIAIMTTLPLLVLSILQGRSYGDRERREIEQQLRIEVVELAERIEGHLEVHRAALIALAVAVEESAPISGEGGLRRLLLRSHQIYPAFLTMLATDDEGFLVATSPAERLARARGPVSVRDRAYFHQPMATGRPFLSDAFRGRGFGTDPIAAISAPYFGPDGVMAGVVEGSLDLASFGNLIPRDGLFAEPQVSVVVLDRSDQVVYRTENAQLDILASLQGSSLLAAIEASADQLVEDPMSTSAGVEPMWVGHTLLPKSSWRVLIRAPQTRLTPVLEPYLLASAWILGAIGVAVLLARWTAEGVTRPFERMAAHLRAFDPESPNEPGGIEVEGPREIVDLASDVEALCGRLWESHRKLSSTLEEREALNQELQNVLTDLDRQVRLRTRELEDARARAEEASRSKSAFLANTSHEIRTPMNGIIGMADLLLETELPSRQRSFVDAIRSSAEALLRVIEDILDFSKIEAGKMNVVEEEFSLRRLVNGVVELVAPRLEPEKVELCFKIDDQLPSMLIGDPARIQQVLLNLMANAIKFTHDGKVELECRGLYQGESLRSVRFEVRDTGIGIAQEAQAHLFQPFTQSDSGTDRRYGGTGLGLAISKRIVDLMGGEIGVDSSPGVGSTFWFQVPLGVPLAERSSTESAVIERSALLSRSGRKVLVEDSPTAPPRSSGRNPGEYRILIAEDHAINRMVALSQLQNLGYAADAVENGLEVFGALEEESYDLLLLDCQMPKLDGYETVRRLRHLEGEGQHLPVIAVTAHAMKGERERCLNAGMDDYLAKPLRQHELAAMLERWLPPAGLGSSQRPEPGADAAPDCGDARRPAATARRSVDLEAVRRSPARVSARYDGIDWETIEQIREIGGNLGNGLLTKVVGRLVETLPSRIEELRQLAETGDHEALCKLAHGLKGTAGNAGARRLSEHFRAIEVAAREGTDDANLGTLLEVVEEENRHLEPVLRELIEEEER